ncbi:cytochrome P450 CYP72A219-like [Coffea eugenioides]|uniref:Cytochrome P450 CYP72A219-like n=1 Tax=Coffea arabica TaxID=13443 RepID=A0A6P6XIG5_COFAR|nr:cytochrome P450 CYP72A219-like [Coffea arabica]XP_027170905.1 cytochrome P450 CYP72A219-like [Coffea eugenioides]
MEEAHSFMIALVSSCCVVLSVLAWRVLNWAWFQPKKLQKHLKQQGFKGNPYKLIYGDLKQISSLFQEANSKPISLSDGIVPRIAPHFLEAVNKYGKNTYLWSGPRPMILIMDPELIRKVTQKMDIFQKVKFHPQASLLVAGILGYEGEKWVKQRKLLNQAFHMEKLKLMVPAFYKSASEMLSKWEEMISVKGSFEVDVWPTIQTMTSDAISRTAFGSRYEEGRKIFELQREQAGHLVLATRSIYIPGSRFLPTKRNRRMKQIAKEVEGSIREIINARLKALRAGEAIDTDMLGLLLATSQETGGESGMTTGEIIEECKLFYVAGQETTAVLLVWTMILLSMHPDWQERAREEVLQHFGTNMPNFDGLNQLKIVTMILHEVLRLYPPISNIGRTVAEETKIGNLTIPAGQRLALPVILLHHDPEIWGEDVKEFKPERFADGVSSATKGQIVYFPFGWGPRICIGANFAILEGKLALAMILQRFSFELSPSYSHAPHQGIALQPQFGAPLMLHKL